MGRLLSLFGLTLLFLVPLTGQAQDMAERTWRKSDPNWARPNSITFTTSLFGFSAYNAQAGPIFPVFNLEYDRIVYRNLSISATGFYAKLDGSLATDTYTMRENFLFAGAKVNYNLPIIRNWLYLRTGIGVGIGIHDANDFFMGETPTSEPPLHKWVKGHMMVDMYLVFRATRWLELKASPLLLSPSQFLFGSRFDAPDYNSTYFYWNPMGTLGLSVRF